jgi:hypothetical protein
MEEIINQISFRTKESVQIMNESEREREDGRQNQIALVYLSESKELARNSVSFCPCLKNLCEPKKIRKKSR